MITITLSGAIPADLVATITELGEHEEVAFESTAIEWLAKRGWAIDRAKDWETPKELCDRLHISPAHLSQSLKKYCCPRPLEVSRGDSGRIIYLRSHPALEKFLTRHINNKK